MGQTTCKVMTRPLGWMALLVGCLVACAGQETPPEGTWVCTSQWNHELDGVNVKRAVEQRLTCTDNVVAVTGVISIGEARWSETKEGTCYASDGVLYGEWSSAHTTAQNDAARNFEKERLGGKSLGVSAKEEKTPYRVRITSRTDTTIKAINDEGRTISCSRI